MKKHILFLYALVFVAQIIWASDIEPSVTLTDYYSTIDTKSGEAIRTALYEKIHAHTTVSYDNLKYLFKWTDTYNNAGVTIDDIYSFCDPAYVEAWCNGNCGYNREHSVPKSWFNEADTLYSDAFHLYPTNCYVNSYRGNDAYGECADGKKCTTNGINAKGRRGTSTFEFNGVSYASIGQVYEPDDEFKGDLARTYFYMITCYMENRFNYADGGIKMFTWQNDTANLSDYSVALLLKWHRQDPVSERELARNEVIYGNTTYNKCQYKQGNRNPYIDYPELAEYIWGNKKGDAVNLATLVSGYSGGYTPPEPPTPIIIVKYGVTWSANGVEIRTDSIQEDKKPDSMPDEPTSCSTESDVFVGWTDAPIAGSTDDAPAVLYKALKDIPAVTEDMTLYAVFAKETVTENVSPASYTFTGTEEGWTNTAYKPAESSNFLLLDAGKSLISPEIDLAGLSEVKATIRTYGSVSQDGGKNLDIRAGETLVASLAAANKTLTEYTWTKTTEVLSGKSALTFTARNAGSKVGIGFSSVTINATGAGVTYSRYITSCSSATEVNLQPTEQPARKILIGGHIYIQIDNQLFNSLGQRVK